LHKISPRRVTADDSHLAKLKALIAEAKKLQAAATRLVEDLSEQLDESTSRSDVERRHPSSAERRRKPR
jgi:hypothetical protein